MARGIIFQRGHFLMLQRHFCIEFELRSFLILTETSTKMYTPFYIGCNLQYGPYAHFGY